MDISNFIAVHNTLNFLQSQGWVEKSIEIEPDYDGWLVFCKMNHPDFPTLTASFAGTESDNKGYVPVSLDTIEDGDEFEAHLIQNALSKFSEGKRLSEIKA